MHYSYDEMPLSNEEWAFIKLEMAISFFAKPFSCKEMAFVNNGKGIAFFAKAYSFLIFEGKW